MDSAITDRPRLACWREGFLTVAQSLGLHPSEEMVRKAAVWADDMPLEDALYRIAGAAGLILRRAKTGVARLPQGLFPAIAETTTGDPVIIWSLSKGQARVSVMLADGVVKKTMAADDLTAMVVGPVYVVTAEVPPRDDRTDGYRGGKKGGWLGPIVRAGLPVMAELSIASAVSALLAISVTLFSMQVWDRVVPAQSLNTLWVLAIGVALALCGDFVLRAVKARLADHYGKSCDRWLSEHVFSRMMDVRNDDRPRSTGSFLAQIRDVEQIREMLTSTTITALIDLPFAALFMGIIWYLGGPLVLVPMAAVLVVLVAGIAVQWPLARLSQEGMAESALRNAVLVESVTRIEDIKQLQAEERFRTLWNRTILTAANLSERQRFYRNMLMFFTMTVQQLAYVGCLVMGVYFVLGSQITTGTLIACSILTSRAIGPMAQLSGLLTVLQNARVSKAGLDKLLALPVDHRADGARFQRSAIRGKYTLSAVVYFYGQTPNNPALVVPQLSVAAGEKVAVIGKIGSGKSTLLRMLSGQGEPKSGSILLDDTEMGLIDVGDLRRDIGYLSQSGNLFFGSIRDNLRIANPSATDAEIAEALRISCADRLLFKQANGLDLQIGEGGTGVSNGQRQALLMARMILRNPRVVILDEPTASLDEGTERMLVDNLKDWLAERTLIVATHRFPILDLAERLIVIDAGRVFMDGPKGDVLQRLKNQ